MKNLRSPEDICLLCQDKKADKKGSHYIPAGLIKREIGDRDYEEIYTINSFHASASVYKGRSNLSNTDTTIKQGEHIADYIFCSFCEKQLGKIESESTHQLVKLTDDISKGNHSVHKTKNRNKYIVLKKPSKNILTLFFYSVIWRQCLQQKLDFETIFTTEEFQENLRGIIAKGITMSLKEIEKLDDFKHYPELIILNTYHKGDRTENFISPNVKASNPELFFIGSYKALIFINNLEFIDFSNNTGLPTEILDKDLIINKNSNSIIGIINESLWTKVDKKLIQYEVERYLFFISEKYSKSKGISISDAQKQLFTMAEKFKVDYPENYFKCLDLALETLQE